MYIKLNEEKKRAILDLLANLYAKSGYMDAYRIALEYFIHVEVLTKSYPGAEMISYAEEVLSVSKSKKLMENDKPLELNDLLLITLNRYIPIYLLEDILSENRIDGNEEVIDDIGYMLATYQPNEKIYLESDGKKNGLLDENEFYSRLFELLDLPANT
jgi:hypothetical protein